MSSNNWQPNKRQSINDRMSQQRNTSSGPFGGNTSKPRDNQNKQSVERLYGQVESKVAEPFLQGGPKQKNETKPSDEVKVQ